jgi:hypothetical protein
MILNEKLLVWAYRAALLVTSENVTPHLVPLGKVVCRWAIA